MRAAFLRMFPYPAENLSQVASHSESVKEKPVHVSQDGYVPKLKWISKKFVVLWDDEDKRGWLVNGTSALLHLLCASLEHNRSDKFKSAFLFKSEEMKEASIQHTADSAIDVLLNPQNMKLEIYPDKGDMYLRLEDRVGHFYNILEMIIDHQADMARQRGVKLKLRVRKRLEGWDFMDLATDQDPFYPRVATLPTIGKRWVDFTRAIHAITLFGRGFGEIMQPPDTSISCTRWAKLPTGRYYLAACVSDLIEIMDMYGNQYEDPMKLSDNIIWHNLGKVFEPCQCTKMSGKHSDLVQVLLPSKFPNMPKKNPVRLKDCGAVIFGHNVNFKLYWKDTEAPVEGEPPSPSEVSETQFHDNGIGSSPGSSAGEGSGGLVGSSSQQPSSEGSSGEPLRAPAAPESSRSDEDELQNASTQRHENRGSAIARQGRRDKRPKCPLLHVIKKLLGRDSNAGEETQG